MAFKLSQLRKGRRGSQIGLVVGAFAFALAPAVVGANVTTMGILTQTIIYSLVVVSLNLLVGFGGLVSIGHAGFLAIGAYAAGYSANHGEFQRSSQRTGHDDRHHPSDEPLEASAWQVQH
jgi:ABC-type branched-subunit amino acid transport system permease subunit